MKKIVISILLLLIIASPSYALSFWEKIAYRKDVIKVYDAKVLVNPLTKEIKYIWVRTSATTGYWAPISGLMKAQFQDIYNRQYKKKM